ncbi:MAG TPA: AarF/UbiB family protein [Gemmatimonadaceae bacterium]|jgi:predicted unusual protein kinase regulating ubiquinone biosynthesis (AarF/ABC1/UbiB family)|nr:AarF/UbiB family protein [Gemmatimonadaceae bacterium]
MILSPRYLPRLAATVGLFTRYGLLDFAKGQGLLSLGGVDEKDKADGAASAEKAKEFRERLVELGPAYVKLGQILSTRPDLLPPAYIEELQHLQDSVEPMPLDVVESTIEQELGARIAKLFGDFDPNPLGSASLGQVHAGKLRDGRDIVIKVQRPNIRELLADDIEYFRELAGYLTDHTSAGDRVDMIGIVQQVEVALRDELDYRTEARNAATFRRSLARFPHVLIPRVIDAYTTHKVLTTERVRGIKISEIPPITRIDHDFAPLAEEFAKAYLYQIAVSGHFHADPHPGNIFVVLHSEENPLTPAEAKAIDRRTEERPAQTPLLRTELAAKREAPLPADPTDPKLAMVDFGMTSHLTKRMRDNVVRLLMSMADNQGDEAAQVLIDIGDTTENFDRAGYVRQISALIAQHADQTVADTPAGLVLYEMISIGYRSGLRLPSELTLLAKALFNLDAVTRALDPSFNPSETIREYAGEIANQRARQDLSPQRLFEIASSSSDLLQALPRRLDTITERMSRNDFAFRIDTPQLPELLEGMQKIANRVLVGLIIAGLLVSSGLLLRFYPMLGLIGLILAGGIGLYVLITALATDRKRDGQRKQ